FRAAAGPSRYQDGAPTQAVGLKIVIRASRTPLFSSAERMGMRCCRAPTRYFLRAGLVLRPEARAAAVRAATRTLAGAFAAFLGEAFPRKRALADFAFAADFVCFDWRVTREARDFGRRF